MTRSVQLWLLIHGSWRSILTIPVSDIHLFTTRPLGWLMFLGYTIYGRQGTLQADPEGPELDDYTINVGSLSDHYYYVAQDEPRLVDVRAVNERLSDAWSHTHTSQADFRTALVDRDGTCVITGESADDCDASHCLPHAKGNEYIEGLTRLRSDRRSDIIDNISDSRNGLLLLHSVHRYVGKGNSAFIMTPNFAMGMDHVPQSPRPVPSSSKRLTLQHFVTVSSSLVQRTAQNNQDARPPADWSIWPPPIILDVLYANAALKRWATQTTMDLIHSWTKDDYYKQQEREQEIADAKATYTAKQVQEHLKQAEERAKRDSAAGRGQEEMSCGDMFDVLLFFSRLSGPRHSLEPNSPRSQPSPEDVSRGKVERWLQSD